MTARASCAAVAVQHEADSAVEVMSHNIIVCCDWLRCLPAGSTSSFVLDPESDFCMDYNYVHKTSSYSTAIKSVHNKQTIYIKGTNCDEQIR